MADDKDREQTEDEAEDASDEERDERDDAEDASGDPNAEESAAEGGEPDEDEAEAPPRPKKKSKKKKKGSARGARETQERPRRPRAPQVMPPEKDIRAPSRQTLWMMGAMTFATLAMWGSARFACNAHPAQTRKPREVSTAELARDPKDAALELQQRWNSYDFKGALELAKGPITEELQKSQSECDKDSAACEQKKKSVEGKALATAALLSKEGSSAKVRVVSRGGAGGEQTLVYALELDGSIWKVAGTTSAPTPAPAPTDSAPPPAPSASAN